MSDDELRRAGRLLSGGTLRDRDAVLFLARMRARAGLLLADPELMFELVLGDGRRPYRVHPWPTLRPARGLVPVGRPGQAVGHARGGFWWAAVAVDVWWSKRRGWSWTGRGTCALTPATNRGVHVWAEDFTLVFATAAELLEYIGEYAVSVRERPAQRRRARAPARELCHCGAELAPGHDGLTCGTGVE